MDTKKLMILVIHAMITNKEMIIGGKVKATEAKNIVTNADILLNGHFHDGYLFHRNLYHLVLYRCYY